MLRTDLLFYESKTGDVAFVPSDGGYTFDIAARASNRWEPNLLLVAGKFASGADGGGVFADLLAYDAAHQQLQFYGTDGVGGRIAVGGPLAAGAAWTHIIPGIFKAEGDYTDLLFYDQTTGEAEFFATDGEGGLERLQGYPFVHWTNIAAGFFHPDAQTMDLLFYDAPRGVAQLYSVWDGAINLHATYQGWATTWSEVVVGRFHEGATMDDVLLYDASQGLARFEAADGNWGFKSIASYPDWDHDWSSVASGYFFDEMACTAVFVYSSARQSGGAMQIDGDANEIQRGELPSFGAWSTVLAGKFLEQNFEAWRNCDEQTLTRVEAYARQDSVAPSESIDFCVEAEEIWRGQYVFDFQIRIDRSGLPDFRYQGEGVARPQATPDDCACSGCGWATSISVEVPEGTRSGVYCATITIGGLSTRVPFVVRPRTANAEVLLEVALATAQAYNAWGGHSLYDGIPLDSARVPTVSFDRPYSVDGDTAMLEAVPGLVQNRLGILSGDFIAWLEESNGLTIDFCTSCDLHLGRVALENYRLLISHWHDEYWSRQMREAVEGFLQQGGNVAFLGANTCWWQVRFDESARLMTCYKYVDPEPAGDAANRAATDDPYANSGDPNEVKLSTIYWWDDRIDWPEISFTGLTFRYGWSVARLCPPSPPRGYTVLQPESWVFAGTGLQAGAVFGQEAAIVGGEVDSALGVSPGGERFGNKYWSLGYPQSPNGLVELAFCDLYEAPGFAGYAVPVGVVAETADTVKLAIASLPFVGFKPTEQQFLLLGATAYAITEVEEEGAEWVLTVSSPTTIDWSGENVLWVSEGWASIGLFQFSAISETEGWVFNAGTVGWTRGLDPSNTTAVSRITLNVLGRLGRGGGLPWWASL